MQRRSILALVFACAACSSAAAPCPDQPAAATATATVGVAAPTSEATGGPALATTAGPSAAPTTERRRLRAKLDERLAAEAKGDKAAVAAVDQSVRDAFEQPLAILVSDMSGLTARTKSEGIISTLAHVRRLFLLADPLMKKHRTEWVKVDADDLIIKAKDPNDLFAFSRALFAAIKAHNEASPSTAIAISIGLGFGPVLVVEHDVWGDAINTASKLGEDVGEPGELLVTEGFYEKMSAATAAGCKSVASFAKRGSKYPFYSCAP